MTAAPDGFPGTGLTWPGADALKWQDKAMCAEVGGDLFYPELGAPMEQAKAVCRACEVRVPCLAYALEARDRAGIYGGFTERVRLRVTREHAAGKSLEDIIADDDEAFYARLEAREAIGHSPEDRKLAAQRRRRSEKRDQLAEATSTPQSRKAA